ncbi:hypothetical protein [Pseudobacter ginsenosidimutans]|uniref:Uncharacterized protein n=1 Tax=Pseudobacter ginsenosidimutans TaxID=661488 RepID=A0A4Q7MFK9_9BACT|nr:hypothetical protein [Pseudobacter ginsenosidimutans]QEC45387.1 hypothetical protein FSB84_28220 [Pseudobacter ginsenosidimutans]RZS66914.1 hypothetical protein EV199_5298 [Pseudobacter ginsenosidimutans]
MINKRFSIIAAMAIICLIACNKIKSGKEMPGQETSYIKKLGLLDKNEQIIKFYSNYKFKNAGNFFTEKRIAKYWIDEHDSSKTQIEYAFYEDIKSIDSITNVPSTYCPYLLVTRKNGSTFKVFVNGKKRDVIVFFEDAMRMIAKR